MATECIHPAGQTDISDHHCRICGAGRGTVLRDLRARISSLRGSLRSIEELSRDGNTLGHNNYVAINQEAECGLDGRIAEVFETPIAFLQEDNRRIESEIVGQEHQGAQLIRLRQMIKDNENAIATLEACRE